MTEKRTTTSVRTRDDRTRKTDEAAKSAISSEASARAEKTARLRAMRLAAADSGQRKAP